MTAAPGCVFCVRIANGDYTAADEHTVAFEPLNPVTPGHLLVVPRSHVPDWRTDPQVTARTAAFAALLGADLPAANLVTSAGAAATQTVWHLHLHIVPRRPGDGLTLPWTGQH